MNNEQQKNPDNRDADKRRQETETPAERDRVEEKIDEELEQSFPASDPPSYSQPGNVDIKQQRKNKND